MLLADLQSRGIPDEIVKSINEIVSLAQEATGDPKAQRKQVHKSYNQIIKLVSAKLKLVPKNYYMTLYMSVGMASFGLPLGVAIGIAADNLGLLGLGLPVGMAIGIAIGAGKDRQAAKEGRQLDIAL